MPGVKSKQKKSVTISSKIEIGKGAKNRVETVREKRRGEEGKCELARGRLSSLADYFPFSHQG